MPVVDLKYKYIYQIHDVSILLISINEKGCVYIEEKLNINSVVPKPTFNNIIKYPTVNIVHLKLTYIL